LLYPYVRMACTVAGGIARELDRDLPRIANELALLFKERVPSRCRQEHKSAAVTKVLNVCEPGSLAPGPRRFPDPQAVLCDQLFIDSARITSSTIVASTRGRPANPRFFEPSNF
jgi:hypothetical protein